MLALIQRRSTVLWRLTSFSRSMNEQAKISAFFQPQSQKRPSSSLANNESADSSSKKSKLDQTDEPEAEISGKESDAASDVAKPSTSSSKKSKLDQTEEPEISEKESDAAKLDQTDEPQISEKGSDAESDAESDAAKPSTSSTSADLPLSLSPQQKKPIEENKDQAQMKLVSTNTHGLVCNMGASWFNALEAEFAKPYILQLGKYVSAERQKLAIYPPEDQVFAWTQTCDIKDVKVVILGQDPYHGPNQAHGLSFSVQKGVSTPPSLANMYKELVTDIEGFKSPGHGYLMGWAEQGVLLLNNVLTVRAKQANSHKNHGWERLTDSVITWLNRNLKGVVFMLWGAHAQKKGAYVNKHKHHILKAVHPSPLSASKGGFYGCKHFSQANELLVKQGKEPIDWTRLPLK